MDIKMEITFSDGSVLNVTELQLKELRSYKPYKTSSEKTSNDLIKIRIIKHLMSNNGVSTSGRIVNALRLYKNINVCNSAIKSLVDDGVIRVTESMNKHRTKPSIILTLV